MLISYQHTHKWHTVIIHNINLTCIYTLSENCLDAPNKTYKYPWQWHLLLSSQYHKYNYHKHICVWIKYTVLPKSQFTNPNFLEVIQTQWIIKNQRQGILLGLNK